MTVPTPAADAAPIAESGRWTARILVEKFRGDDLTAEPYEVVETENLLMHGGVSALWQFLLGNGTTTADQALTYFNNTRAAIGVGNGSTAAAATQTNLQGGSKLRKGMNATYPQHSDGTGSGAKTITFQATFSTAEANFAWEEVGVFNSVTDATGRMLNRRAEALGTKTSSSSWQVTVTIEIN